MLDHNEEYLAGLGVGPEYPPVVEFRDGIPVWTHRLGAIPVTTELVRNLADDE